MKKLLSLVLCGAMAVSVTALTGCSKDYPTEKGATSIMFYAQDFEDWSNEHLYEKVKEFNSNLNDGIQIEMRMYEDSEYTQALTSAREGGYAPDIYMVSYGNLAGDIQKKYPAVVNDLLPQSAFDDLLTTWKKWYVTTEIITVIRSLPNRRRCCFTARAR